MGGVVCWAEGRARLSCEERQRALSSPGAVLLAASVDHCEGTAVTVGRFPKKVLDVFLAALDPAYELVAVTDRPPSAEPKGVRVMPFVAPKRLREILCAVDAFVLPSEGEGFPVSLQEALAAGLPVVTTFQPGYDRFLSPDDVLYVERDPDAVRGALRRLVDDIELRGRLAERALAVAEQHFGVGQFVTAYEELYAEARRRRS